MENNNVKNQQVSEAELERAYSEDFIPAVHRIGIPYSAVAFVLMFLPVLYFYFVCGYTLSSSWIIGVIVSNVSINCYDWITESLTYYPMMGSAPIYMAFLSGNAYNQRLPVAIAAQKMSGAKTHTLKGQIITIIGVGTSIFFNLALLLVTVFVGDKLLSVLPAAVVAAFSFALPSMMGVTFPMFLETDKGYLKGLWQNLPYIIVGVTAVIIADNNDFLCNYDIMFAMICTVCYSFIHYLICKRKAAKQDGAQA